MLEGVERLVDLRGPQLNGTDNADPAHLTHAIHTADISTLTSISGQFSGTARDGQTVRLARTIAFPLRYFVAKMFHGPFLIVSDRIDSLFNWCTEEKVGWQFDPQYSRMVPAHYLIEIDQIGCPDPTPRYHRFFDPPIAEGTDDLHTLGSAYIAGAYDAVKRWIGDVPNNAPIALAYSGGIDSTAVWLMARQALSDLGDDPNRIRAFTLDLGGGADAQQAEHVARDLGLFDQWERVKVDAAEVNFESAIATIEDYHPLDVECAAVAICLLEAIKTRHPEFKYLLDGDGGDENLKDYPLEDSDLTLSSVLRNPMLYQEGWGVDKIKHSLTYSGGLSRSYVRTYAPAATLGFNAFSPFADRSAMAPALSIPFETVLNGSVERLYTLKAELVKAGILHNLGIDMPTPTKRRFQDGVGGDTYKNWRVSKAWCRQVFMKQWEERLRLAWDPASERFSGNDISRPFPVAK